MVSTQPIVFLRDPQEEGMDLGSTDRVGDRLGAGPVLADDLGLTPVTCQPGLTLAGPDAAETNGLKFLFLRYSGSRWRS